MHSNTIMDGLKTRLRLWALSTYLTSPETACIVILARRSLRYISSASTLRPTTPRSTRRLEDESVHSQQRLCRSNEVVFFNSGHVVEPRRQDPSLGFKTATPQTLSAEQNFTFNAMCNSFVSASTAWTDSPPGRIFHFEETSLETCSK